MKVVCLRCRRPQQNRTAEPTENAPTPFYLGCVSCGYPYGAYVKERSK